MIVKLTPEFIKNGLICPEGKHRTEYVDNGGTGLYVEVRATAPGQGTYYLRYKDANGKTCHQKIGRTTEMDLDEARRRAKTLKAEITLGGDPRAERRPTRFVVTSMCFSRSLRGIRETAQAYLGKGLELYNLRLKGASGAND